MSRAYTEQEMRDMFVDQLRALVEYWTNLVKKGESTYENAIEGVVFSTLTIFDGGTSFPACKVIPIPHPTDKQFHIKEGENYFPKNVDIIDGETHSYFLNKGKKKG